MVTAMNRFTQQEAYWAEILANQHKITPFTLEQLETQAKHYVREYAEPEDRDAAAVALVHFVIELLQ